MSGPGLVSTLKTLEPTLCPQILAPEELEKVNKHFDEYFKSYTSLSLRLFGRWPAFVDLKDRHGDFLGPGTDLAPGPSIPKSLFEMEEEARGQVDMEGENKIVVERMQEEIGMLTERIHALVRERDESHERASLLSSLEVELRATGQKLKESETRQALLQKRAEEAEERSKANANLLKEERSRRTKLEKELKAVRTKIRPLQDDNARLTNAFHSFDDVRREIRELDSSRLDDYKKLLAEKDAAVRQVASLEQALHKKNVKTSVQVRQLNDREAVSDLARESAEAEAKRAVAKLTGTKRQLQTAMQQLVEVRHEKELAEERELTSQRSMMEQSQAATQAIQRASEESKAAARIIEDVKKSARKELETKDEEQRRIFVVLSELIGRILCMESVSALSERKADMLTLVEEQKEGALRHLRRLHRHMQANADTVPLEVAPETAKMGAAVLRVACDAQGADARSISRIATRAQKSVSDTRPSPQRPNAPMSSKPPHSRPPRPGLARKLSNSRHFESTDWEKTKLLSFMREDKWRNSVK